MTRSARGRFGDRFKLKICTKPYLTQKTVGQSAILSGPPAFAEMQEPLAEVLVLDGEARRSRAIQETSNRLVKTVESLLYGS